MRRVDPGADRCEAMVDLRPKTRRTSIADDGTHHVGQVLVSNNHEQFITCNFLQAYMHHVLMYVLVP